MISVASVLTQLDELLTEEREALVKADLKAVMALGSKKAELLQVVTDPSTQVELTSSEDLVATARRVLEAGQANYFLLRHLRGCLQAVGPAAGTVKATYGPDGRSRLAIPGRGTTLARTTV